MPVKFEILSIYRVYTSAEFKRERDNFYVSQATKENIRQYLTEVDGTGIGVDVLFRKSGQISVQI